MNYVGIDLHKSTIVVCVVDQQRKVLQRQKFLCLEVARIREWFIGLGAFEFVVEATAAYEWLVQLLEPLAVRWVLAHPGKLRVIAESTKKTDKHDAQVLAEFLALDMLPQAYRPTLREREHRQLVRYRTKCQQRVTRVTCQIRYLAATYNADHKTLFQAESLAAFVAKPELTGADRFIVTQRVKEFDAARQALLVAKRELRRFAKAGSEAEQKQRELLRSVPGVGEVVSEVVLAELGDVDRFPSLKEATAYAGLVPGRRESDAKSKDLGITKKGSKVLRWAMVEAAWVAVSHSARWRGVYEGLKRRRQAKRAIIAVARRLLAVLVSMLKSGKEYRWSLAELKDREARAAARKKAREAKLATRAATTTTTTATTTATATATTTAVAA